MDKRDKQIAIALLSIMDCDKQHPNASVSWAETYYKACEESTVHDGDCTKKPWTCLKCNYEEFNLQAKAIRPVLEKIFKEVS